MKMMMKIDSLESECHKLLRSYNMMELSNFALEARHANNQ